MDRSSTKFNSLITLKREKIILESFPNEFLLELFELLHAAELFHAFHDLNIRFNALLFTRFRVYRVNFHSVLKHQSDFVAQYYLS